jgi:2-polyprenyl-3-methyl-5-hydroxy-6-metoxy-1,4-benzoquinol methylase
MRTCDRGILHSVTAADGWNRNNHYHNDLLAALPINRQRVLDVGCGHGTFARRLSRIATHVDALDRDRAVVAEAEWLSHGTRNVRFIEADFVTWHTNETYDALSMIAVLHHLPFQTALLKASTLLRPGGVLLVLGLDRSPSWTHYLATGAVATLLSRWYRGTRRPAPVRAPIAEPQMTLTEIRRECATLLPGADIRRLALLRYLLTWTKPD